MTKSKLAILTVVLVCLATTATTTRLTAGGLDDEARYESSQRLWYPRGAIGLEEQEAKHSGRQHQPSTRPFRQSLVPVGLKSPSMVSRARWIPSGKQQLEQSVAPIYVDKRAAKYIYMMSPLNEQILEIGSGQKSINGLVDWPKQEAARSNWPQMMARGEPLLATSNPNPGNTDECLTLTSPVLITRDDLDKVTGQLIRNCRGLIELNRCEGACNSLVQPSVKSRTGLKRECSCCNESSFRQIQVRLTECYSAAENRLIRSSEDPEMSYMDIGLDEPIECKCRRCDS